MKSGLVEADSARPGAATVARSLTALFLGIGCAWSALVAAGCRVAIGFVGLAEIAPKQIEELFLTMRIHGVTAAGFVVMLLIVRRRPSNSTMSPRIALLGLLFFFAISTDRVVGIFFPPGAPTSPILAQHPRRGFSHRLNTVGFVGGRRVAIDGLGFRRDPAGIPESTNETRILFLGDSVTFGYLLPDNQTIVSRAEAALADRREGGKTIRCLNAGVVCYSTWQELDLLRDEGRRAAPDIVVLTFCMNDLLDVAVVGRGVLRGSPGDFSTEAGNHWSGIVRAIEVFAAARRARQAMDRGFWDNTPAGFGAAAEHLREFDNAYEKPMSALYQETWKVVLKDMTAIRDTCLDMNATFVILYATPTFELKREERFQVHRSKLRDWANENGIPFVDPTEAFRAAVAEGGARTEDIMMDTIHPTDAGIRIMVDALVDRMEREGLVPTK